MINLIQEFYFALLSSIKGPFILPMEIASIIYDPRFTPDYVIENIKPDEEFDYVDIPQYYQYLFSALDSAERFYMCFICDSDDINEDIIHGSYSYYYGFIYSPESIIPFLYMQPSHGFAFPARVIFYDPKYQIYVNNDCINIEICETIQSIRNKFFIENKSERIYELKEFLMETDRPILDP